MKFKKKDIQEAPPISRLMRILARREDCYYKMTSTILEMREGLSRSESENQMWRDFYKENKKELEPIIIEWNKKRDLVS